MLITLSWAWKYQLRVVQTPGKIGCDHATQQPICHEVVCRAMPHIRSVLWGNTEISYEGINRLPWFLLPKVEIRAFIDSIAKALRQA